MKYFLLFLVLVIVIGYAVSVSIDYWTGQVLVEYNATTTPIIDNDKG